MNEIFYLKEESLLEHNEVSSCFLSFLQKEFCAEPFLFLKQEKEFEKLTNDEEIIQEFIKIVDDYIKEKSKYELYLSYRDKKEALEYYDIQKDQKVWSLTIKHVDIFRNITKSLKTILLADNYARFVRTKECLDLIKKYKGFILKLKLDNENIVIIKKQKITYPYSMKDFCYR
jgi:hypothetical protein